MSKRGPYLPLEQRIGLYHEVLQLREQGLSYKDIIERIHRRSGVRLNKSHISFWVNRVHQPLGKVNKFDGRPPPELAGIIGVQLSDGNRYLANYYDYRLRLRVKDRDYAEAFGHDLAKVLEKSKPYKPHWNRSEQCWMVSISSILLFKHLNRPWQELKPDIEANKTCVARFLKGFFDGEGNVDGRALTVHNTNRELLLYVQQLLRLYFGIETTGPHRKGKKGHRFHGTNGKIYEAKKDWYYLYVRARSLPLFHEFIVFTIKRKQRRLDEAIQ